jgi:hypothetical protein
MSVVITLPVLPAPIDELWHTLLDLDDRLDVPWSLVGGQMVLLHVLEHGEVPPQVSQDGDVIADIRAAPGALKQVVECLEDLGLVLQSISTDGLAHRYIRPAVPRHVVIDVLAPEGPGGARGSHDQSTRADYRGSRRHPGTEPDRARSCRA